MKGRWFVAAAIALVTAFSFSSVAPAHAYSINGQQPAAPAMPAIGNGSSGIDLAQPFVNFFQSLGSVGKISVPTSINSAVSQGVKTQAQGFWDQFDTWLYGVAGFHISGLLTAILSILSWILGIVKSAVDWLLGLIH